MSDLAWQAPARPSFARQGRAGIARQRSSCAGGLGTAGVARHVAVRRVGSSPGKAGLAVRGRAMKGAAWLGRRGMARLGRDRQCRSRQATEYPGAGANRTGA